MVATLAASGVLDTGATFTGTVNANGTAPRCLRIRPDPGLIGNTVRVPASFGGTAETPVNAVLTGLLSGTTYHYRVVATNAGGTVWGGDRMFTTSDFASERPGLS